MRQVVPACDAASLIACLSSISLQGGSAAEPRFCYNTTTKADGEHRVAKKSGFAVNVEYGALRLACGLVNAIPYPVAMWLASFAAVFAVRVLRFKRARTMERISSVFPEKDKSERLRIAVRSLANVLQTAVEMIRAPRLTRKWMDRHVVDGQMYKDRLQAYVDEGKGVVIMVPHSGNWYMAAWAMAAYGFPLFAIAAKQRNPKIDAWMKRQYGAIEVLERGSAKTLVEIKEKLESGRAFAILPEIGRAHV